MSLHFLMLNCEFDFSHGVALDSADNLYIADRNNQRIRKVDGRTTSQEAFSELIAVSDQLSG